VKSFSKWTIEEVEETFHVVQQRKDDQLELWMTPVSAPSDTEKQQLQLLQEKLLDNVWNWNEEELKVYFIIPLLELIRFEETDCKPFLSRELTMTVEDDTVSGIVDFMVASGRRSPKRPYFFIHEYKKEHDSSNDPLGQLMIEMVAAQHLNADNHPVYGAYVMGRYWHFVVLNERSYAVHTGFNAADEGLLDIFGVLQNSKKIIREWNR
jgi:hypothetical protein